MDSSNELTSLDKKAAFQSGFFGNIISKGKDLASKAGASYVADAVRGAHMQHLRAVMDDPMTMHGVALKAFEENGAIGASAIHTGINKARVALGDMDTALGAMAVGKKGMADPTHKSLRKTLFTFTKDNYHKVNKSDGTHTLVQQSRPSISAPFNTLSNYVVPGLAMMKGQELIGNFKNRKEVNHAGDGNTAGYPN